MDALLLTIYLPLVMATPYHWQDTGYVRPPAAIDHDQELHAQGMWSYDHNPVDCLSEVPLWMSWLYQPDWGPCAATAPVLMLLNEPEWGGQSDMTPEEAVGFVRYAEERWPGELYCCGNLVSHAGWLDRFLAAYSAQYGKLPRLSGVHVHVYPNDGFPVDDAADPRWLARSQRELVAYLAVMRRWGLPDRLVVSECCALSGANMPAAMAQHMAWLRSVPEVETVAWFSARHGAWRQTNLLQADGGLTELGRQWRNWRWQ